VHLVRELGEPKPVPADLVDRLYDRYRTGYGQQAKV
jgi:L-ribulose-5-phosphate 4-epimerase